MESKVEVSTTRVTKVIEEGEKLDLKVVSLGLGEMDDGESWMILTPLKLERGVHPVCAM